MPGGRSRNEDDLFLLDLSPEQTLVAAMLRCAVQDARSQAKASRFGVQRREDAQRWLRDKRQVCYWLDMIGLPARTYARLLKEAGMEDQGC